MQKEGTGRSFITRGLLITVSITGTGLTFSDSREYLKTK
jgi:hypothetical protein